MHKQSLPTWLIMHVYNSKKSEHLKANPGTLGRAEDLAEEDPKSKRKPSPYGIALRSLIAETLLVNPTSRISIRQLVSKTKLRLEVARKVAGIEDEPGQVFSTPDEPMLDPGWYSGQFNHPVSNFSEHFISLFG
jgi:hypothetical protein